MELQVTLSDKGKIIILLSAVVMAAAAYFSYEYWRTESISTNTMICLGVLAASGAIIVIISWNLARLRRATVRSEEPVFYVIESGPKHAPKTKEELKPKIKTKMPNH